MPSSRLAVLAFLALAASVGLGACGENGPNEPGPGPDFDFSGDLIAFLSERDGPPEIYLMTADGAEFINITNNAAADSDADWSPDGSRIAFASDRDGNVAQVTKKLTR